MTEATPSRARKIGIFILIVLGIIFGSVGVLIIKNGWDERQNAIKILNGKLSNPFEVNTSEPFNVWIGSNVYVFSPEELEDGVRVYHPLSAGYASNFKIRFVEKKLSVGAEIKNADNKIIAQIIDNKWRTVNPENELFLLDRNYNDYAFEVIGSNEIPILQIIMIGPKDIQIGGIVYYSKSGPTYVLYNDNGDTWILDAPSDEQLQSLNISKIFKYPANSTNLGKLDNPIYSSTDPLEDSFRTMLIGGIIFITGAIFAGLAGIYTKYK